MCIEYQLRQQSPSEYKGILKNREAECRGAGWMGRRGRLTLEMHRFPLPLALAYQITGNSESSHRGSRTRNEVRVVRSVGVVSLWILAGEVGKGFTRLRV